MSLGSQSGQSLVAALAVMTMVFGAAGALAVGVGALFRVQPQSQAAAVSDLQVQSRVAVAAAFAATKHDPAAQPCLSPTLLSGTQDDGLLAGDVCLELPVGGPAVHVAPLSWQSGCWSAGLTGADPKDWFWLTADLPAGTPVSAWVDASPGGCTPPAAGPCSSGPLSAGGGPIQVAFACAASAFGSTASLHLAAPQVSPLTGRPPARAVRYATYADARPFLDAPGTPLGGFGKPASVVSADVTGDGLPDLVVADPAANSVSVWKNLGGGSFAQTWSFAGFDSAPIAAVAADVGGPLGRPDGKPDLVVIRQNDDELDVFLGNGDGTFGGPIQTDLNLSGDSTAITAVAAVDLNGDGRPDLALGTGDGKLYVLLGRGDGTFPAQAPGSPFALENNALPTAVVAADFDGRNGPDLAVTERTLPKPQPDQVEVLLNNGGGTFTDAAGSPFAVGNGAVALAAGPLDSSGNQGLAVVNQADATLSVLLGNGDGTFRPAPGSPLRVGTSPVAVAFGQGRNDAGPELFVANQGSSTVSVLVGAGTGAFTPLKQGPVQNGQVPVGGSPSAVSAADFDGDGRVDFASADTAGADVSVKLRNPPPWGAVFTIAAPAPTSTSGFEEADLAVPWDGSAGASGRLAYEGAI